MTSIAEDTISADERDTSAADNVAPGAGDTTAGEPTAEEAPRVLTCRTTADFLAALPQLTGFTAKNSIFLVLFAGNRASAAIRVDLPRAGVPEQRAAVVDFISEMLTEHGNSEPAIVVTSVETFAETGGVPWRSLAEEVARRLRRDGSGVRELCCLAPDGWGSYLDPSIPKKGRPLSEISESPIALATDSGGGATCDLETLGALPDPDSESLAAVAAALTEQLPLSGAPPPTASGSGYTGADESTEESIQAGAAGSDAEWAADTAAALETVVQGGTAFHAERYAEVIRCAADSERWLVLALTALTRPAFVTDLVAASPLRSWSAPKLLSALTREFTDQARLRSVITAVTTVTSVTPRELRPGPLAFLAWLWWMRGLQTVSRRHVSAALEIDPEHTIVQMVERLTRTSAVHAALLARAA